MSILVEFNGQRFWYLGHALTELNYALAYLHQCDDNGDVIELADSYAHVCSDGIIRRFGKVIGTIRDLRPVGPLVPQRAATPGPRKTEEQEKP